MRSMVSPACPVCILHRVSLRYKMTWRVCRTNTPQGAHVPRLGYMAVTRLQRVSRTPHQHTCASHGTDIDTKKLVAQSRMSDPPVISGPYSTRFLDYASLQPTR